MPSASDIENAQLNAAQSFIQKITNLEQYFSTTALTLEQKFVVADTPFLEVDFNVSGTIKTKGSNAVTITVENGETLATEFDVLGGLTSLGATANVDMTNPKQMISSLAASVKTGSIQVEIEQPDSPEGVLTVSLSAIWENIPVTTSYNTEAEVKLIFKYRNSISFPNVTLPNTEEIYALNQNIQEINVPSAIAYQILGSIQNVYGTVADDAATLGTGENAGKAIAAVITVLFIVVAAAALSAA